MKIPVTKTVMRNGKQHVQTYWEEDDKNSNQPSLLSALGISLPKQQKAPSFPTDPALEKEWSAHVEDGFDADDAQAAIAAGLSFGAAQSIIRNLPEWSSFSDYVYENNLDEMPRPKGGWRNKEGYASDDQRRQWEQSGVPLETAVEWIDAGFDIPSGVDRMIRAGASLERAKQWDEHRNTNPLKSKYGGIWGATDEIVSGISLEDAIAYRKAFHGNEHSPLEMRHLDYYRRGIPPEAAGRWHNAKYDEVRLNQVVALRELKWSPTAIRNVAKLFTGRNEKKFGLELAEALIEATPKVGSPKLVTAWADAVRVSSYEAVNGRQGVYGTFTDEAIAKIHDAEAFKKRALKETGVQITDDDNYDLMNLSPSHRDAYIDLMNTENREGQSVRETMNLAKFVGSSENFNILKNNGFVFGDPSTGEAFRIPYGDRSYDGFDATSADDHSRNKWMKELAFRMYSKKVRQTEARTRWTEDDNVDPAQLKDLLLSDPEADDMRLEAVLVNGVSKTVSSGWL